MICRTSIPALSLVLILGGTAHASESAQLSAATGSTKYQAHSDSYSEKPALRPASFEISAAAMQSFLVPNAFNRTDNIKVPPTTSAFFVGEYFLNADFRVSMIYNMPTSSDVEIVDGKRVETFASSQAALGLIWAPFHFPFGNNSEAEFQLGASGAVELSDSPTMFPMFLGRLYARLRREGPGPGMFLGSQYSPIINRIGLIYGVANRF